MAKAVVFDLGGVLVDWNLRYLYGTIFDDADEMERFLGSVFTFEANHRLDAGEAFADVIGELQHKFPQYHTPLEALLTRWPETLGEQIEGTVEILEQLHSAEVPLYALTNWSAETFPFAQERFPFLQHFRGITVSGEVKLAKPDPAIYRRLLTDFSLTAENCVFIDDRADNILMAKDLGFETVHFIDPEKLKKSLIQMNLLSDFV
ncbi:HAD family phosphatase [Kiloniella laminariae]|uniref:HAD family phosphatase n=1 Tax=Kiloniella laminariae TaxID=454162 RepID=A0ABT4LNY1_9PROT|nr:HAD family phosphatase [Kiloniella laminariae]MCZ4282847.1 HAD family phosphatase [Kiloniella laminariae]